jgi:hypothetical protein
MVSAKAYLILFYVLCAISSICLSMANELVSAPQAPPPIYYISTHEGLLSHFRQLEIFWNGAKQFNRSIIATGFYSHHYQNYDTPITLCDVFILPSLITCSKVNNQTVIKERNCTFTGAIHSSRSYYQLDLPIESNYSYQHADCVAGAINAQMGYPPYKSRKNMLVYPIFIKKYLNLLPLIRKILKLSKDQEYIIAHWRRGDQLSRCASPTDRQNFYHHHMRNRTKKRRDYSINCGNATEFLQGFADEISKYIAPSSLPMLAYVSTNERNGKVLKQLEDSGVRLFSHIKSGLEHRGVVMTPLDEFAIELMMMCLDATYLFAWGDSSSHGFFHSCRMIDRTKKRVTVIEDPGSAGKSNSANGFHITSDKFLGNILLGKNKISSASAINTGNKISSASTVNTHSETSIVRAIDTGSTNSSVSTMNTSSLSSNVSVIHIGSKSINVSAINPNAMNSSSVSAMSASSMNISMSAMNISTKSSSANAISIGSMNSSVSAISSKNSNASAIYTSGKNISAISTGSMSSSSASAMNTSSMNSIVSVFHIGSTNSNVSAIYPSGKNSSASAIITGSMNSSSASAIDTSSKNISSMIHTTGNKTAHL